MGFCLPEWGSLHPAGELLLCDEDQGADLGTVRKAKVELGPATTASENGTSPGRNHLAFASFNQVAEVLMCVPGKAGPTMEE